MEVPPPNTSETIPVLDSPASTAVSESLWHWSQSAGGAARRDLVAREEPLEIRVQGRCIAVTMRTPGHDLELAAGFLLSEGLIRRRADVLELAHCRLNSSELAENILNVYLAPGVSVNFEQLQRHVYTSSSCGLCGKTSIESVRQHFLPVSACTTVKAELLLGLPAQLRALQPTFAQTGGLHAAGVFTEEGRPISVREDVGRHNAVDKAIGAGFLNDLLPFDSHILVVSGRASFEIMQKALAARIPVVAAISAPSSLAVEFARENNQTLVGFVRGSTMNIYSGHERIQDAQQR